jgi:hypothetical protein
MHEGDAMQFPRLLRLDGERRQQEAESKHAGEYPSWPNRQSQIGNRKSFHWITSSARIRSDWGMVNPRSPAGFSLLTNSNGSIRRDHSLHFRRSLQ